MLRQKLVLLVERYNEDDMEDVIWLRNFFLMMGEKTAITDHTEVEALRGFLDIENSIDLKACVRGLGLCTIYSSNPINQVTLLKLYGLVLSISAVSKSFQL